MSLTLEQWRDRCLSYAKALRLVRKYANEIPRSGKIKQREAEFIVTCWNSAVYDEETMQRIPEEGGDKDGLS